MRPIFAVVVCITLLLLGGCGSDAITPDPLVGTWTDSRSPDVELVIEKHGSQYAAVASKGEWTLALDYTLDGDTLTAVERPAGYAARPAIRYHAASDTVQFTPFGENVTLMRSGSPE